MNATVPDAFANLKKRYTNFIRNYKDSIAMLGRNKASKSVLLAISLTLPIYLTTLPPFSANAEFSTEACVTFTKKGEEIGDTRHCNQEANDIHIAFHGKCEIQFTSSGEPNGDPIPCPKGANGATLQWDPSDCEITGGSWTKKGNTIGSISVPSNSDDFHLRAGKVVLFVWTKDGSVLGDPVPSPPGANDIEFDCVAIPT